MFSVKKSMGLRGITRRISVIGLIVCILLIGCLYVKPTTVRAAVSLSVDTGTVIQDNYLGTGAVYHGFAYMPESNAKGYNDTLRNIEFNRVADMSLHLARTWYRPDWACGQSGYPGYDWNSTKMTAFYNWLEDMKDRNVDVAINAGWWLPNDVYNVFPFDSADSTTWSTRLTQWAAWMSESLNQIISVRGYTNVKYVMLFTEPTYVSGILPSGYTELQCLNEATIALHNRLVSDGRRNLVKLVGPNYNVFTDVTPVKNGLNSYIDIYSSHGYNEQDYIGWYNKAVTLKNQISSTGKPFWVDEYGKSNETYRNTADYGNYLAQAVAAFINAGAQSSQIWLLFDQQYTWPLDTKTNADSFYNGVHKWGTTQFLPSSQVPRQSYYIFSLMSKYLGGAGTKVYQTTSATGIYICAVKLTSGDWSYMVVNGTSSPQDITVDLSAAVNKTLYRYLYNPAIIVPDSSASIIGYDKTFSSVTTNFSDTLPAKGVAIYSSIQGNQAIPSNLAYNKVITASSSYESSEWGRVKSVDGQINSVTGSLGWSSNNSTSTNHTEWIQVDLGAANQINRVDLYPRNDGTVVGWYFPIDFTIQTSIDGINWTTVVTQSGYPLPGNSVQAFKFAATNARYVRITGTNLRNHTAYPYRMQFAEIGVYSENLACNKTVTSSSSFEDAGWGIIKAADGQRNSVTGYLGWSSNNSISTNHTEWVQIDLGASNQVSKVDLYPRNDGTAVGWYFPVDFTIQTSTDGNNWTTVVTQTGYALPGNSVQSFSFNATNARYVRVTGTSLRYHTAYRMQFAEIEVY